MTVTMDEVLDFIGRLADATQVATVQKACARRLTEVTLFTGEACATASPARHVRSSGNHEGGEEAVSCLPPGNDRTTVDLCGGPEQSGGGEGHTLHAGDISHRERAPLSLLDAEACAAANSSAVFHPQESPDGEGLPCIELAGILVFAYLDADRGSVRISVHLDTTDEQLVRADGTVPIQVEIETATVYDSLNPTPAPAPADPTG